MHLPLPVPTRLRALSKLLLPTFGLPTMTTLAPISGVEVCLNAPERCFPRGLTGSFVQLTPPRKSATSAALATFGESVIDVLAY